MLFNPNLGRAPKFPDMLMEIPNVPSPLSTNESTPSSPSVPSPAEVEITIALLEFEKVIAESLAEKITGSAQTTELQHVNKARTNQTFFIDFLRQ